MPATEQSAPQRGAPRRLFDTTKSGGAARKPDGATAERRTLTVRRSSGVARGHEVERPSLVWAGGAEFANFPQGPSITSTRVPRVRRRTPAAHSPLGQGDSGTPSSILVPWSREASWTDRPRQLYGVAVVRGRRGPQRLCRHGQGQRHRRHRVRRQERSRISTAAPVAAW